MKTALTPQEIVRELDRHIVAQKEAKRAVAVALRNRWRRQHVETSLQEEIVPKNILMLGPTGVGKTEIARRLAKLVNAPFIKVEATKFTEVGYVGRDVEQIIRDLLETAITMVRAERMAAVSQVAKEKAESEILKALVGVTSAEITQDAFRKGLADGGFEDKEIDIQVSETPKSPLGMMDLPGVPGAQMGMMNLGDILKGMGTPPKKKRRVTVAQGRRILIDQITEEMLDGDAIIHDARIRVEQHGIVFIDEIDKITTRAERSGGDVSREGVQRDLLPLIEGTAVSTKHGVVRTDHVLFITSGAFHLTKPSDLLPELQGRLPIRVELSPLSVDDFVRILTETESSLIEQYTALLKTENVALEFSKDAIHEIAMISVELNQHVENIGARRLHTVLEKLLEEINFTASDVQGSTYTIDAALVRTRVGSLVKQIDLSKFIL
ncbi:MAG: ATP-dependent protease ATPase subunit HslU [Alphaproteobacteria bacterium]|nr:MAG: ATP-dependent protease ATPase subunit HslU [Alphaproteobacteria bacterium]